MRPRELCAPSLFTLLLTLSAWPLGGCSPTGVDCFPLATVEVTVASSVAPETASTLVVAAVADMYDGDVTGTDANGLPVGTATDQAGTATTPFEPDRATYSLELEILPYPTYFYAFIDL